MSPLAAGRFVHVSAVPLKLSTCPSVGFAASSSLVPTAFSASCAAPTALLASPRGLLTVPSPVSVPLLVTLVRPLLPSAANVRVLLLTLSDAPVPAANVSNPSNVWPSASIDVTAEVNAFGAPMTKLPLPSRVMFTLLPPVSALAASFAPVTPPLARERAAAPEVAPPLRPSPAVTSVISPLAAGRSVHVSAVPLKLSTCPASGVDAFSSLVPTAFAAMSAAVSELSSTRTLLIIPVWLSFARVTAPSLS